MKNKVIVLGEKDVDRLERVSLESLTAAKYIANGGEVVGVLLGEDLQTIAKEMIHYGADRTIIIEDETFKDYSSDSYAQAIFKLIEKEKPDGIIFGHTTLGIDIAPRIANRVESGLVSSVTGIERNGNDFTYTKPVGDGKACERQMITHGIPFATILPGHFYTPEIDKSRTGPVHQLSIQIENLRTTVLRSVSPKMPQKIEGKTSVIFTSAGFANIPGLWELLNELAEILDRNSALRESDRSFGFCVTCGFSELDPLDEFLEKAEVVIAIHESSEAPIFEVADYKIIGNVRDVIPALLEELQGAKMEVCRS